MNTLTSARPTVVSSSTSVTDVAVLIDGSVDPTSLGLVRDALSEARTARLAIRTAAPHDVPRRSSHSSESLPFTADRDAAMIWLERLARERGTPSYGLAIQCAVDELTWTAGAGARRVLVVVGAAPFDDGPVDAETSLVLARSQGIDVLLVHVGDPAAWPASSWRSAADGADVPLVAAGDLSATLAGG